MSAWAVMIGMQFLMFGIAGIWTIIWMTRPKDEYDEILEEMETGGTDGERP